MADYCKHCRQSVPALDEHECSPQYLFERIAELEDALRDARKMISATIDDLSEEWAAERWAVQRGECVREALISERDAIDDILRSVHPAKTPIEEPK